MNRYLLAVSLAAYTVLSADSGGTQDVKKSLSSKTQGKEEAAIGIDPQRLSLRHIEARGIGYNQGYSTIDGFFAPGGMIFTPFLDVRGHIFNDGKLAANLGAGLRYLDSMVWGFNIYYDFRQTRHHNYDQIGIGFEALGEVWDFRWNAYFPFGKTTSHWYNKKFDSFRGNRMYVSRKREIVMTGTNAEVGAHFEAGKYVDMYAAAGPYYYTGNGRQTFGGEGRLFATVYDYLGLQLSGSYDSIFKGIIQGEVSVRIPLGKNRKVAKREGFTERRDTALRQRTYQRVDRNEIIVASRKRHVGRAINPETGQPYTFLFVNNTSHSQGTFESPFNTLANAQNAAGPGDVIYVFPGDNTTTGMSNGIVLQDNQQLLGGSIDQVIQTTIGNIKIPAQASSNFLPSLTNTSGDVITLANNNVVSGFLIQNVTSGNGIKGTGVYNGTVTRNIFILPSSSTGSGLELSSAAGSFAILGNTFSNNGAGHSIYINNSATPVSNANYTMTGNMFSGYGSYPIYFNDVNGSNNTYNFSNNNVLQSTSTYAINIVTSNAVPNVPHSFLISNNTMAGGQRGVNMSMTGTLSQVVITNNNLSFSTFGLFTNLLGASQMTATIQGNTIIGGTYATYIELENSSIFSGEITNNFLQSLSNDNVVDIFANASTAAIPYLNVSNNTIVGGNSGIVMYHEATSTSFFNIENNTIIASNTRGIDIENQGAGNLVAKVVGNTFQGFAVDGAYLASTGSGTFCLQLNNNTSNLDIGAYVLSQSSGTFNLVTPQGNIGQLSQTGLITPVSSCQ